MIRKVFYGTHYILYIREKVFLFCFWNARFFRKTPDFTSRFLFFKYVTWRFSPCGRIYFFFCLDTKEEVTRRKNQGYVSGPTPERTFWRWKMNSLRCTTLRQHFSAPPVHSYAHAPTTRPILFSRQGASLLALGFMLTCLRLLLFGSLLRLLCEVLINIALIILSSRTEFSILRLSIYILNLSLYILKLSFYILSLSIELLWWRK